MILAVSLIACILISLLIAVVTGYFIRSASLKKWEELPRKRGAGAVLGLLALLFFIPNVEPMFSAKENLTVLVIAAIVLTVLCYLYLDYLFSRAFDCPLHAQCLLCRGLEILIFFRVHVFCGRNDRNFHFSQAALDA